ncbi:hypothetical protein ACFY1U_43920 [Streptomyces sp. NPDC001351]|uniref:hypothetical protein n=1 Tax=Streptomyces sp. NPDC001351 TaxID=3364564 RepID=UPI00367CBD9E
MARHEEAQEGPPAEAANDLQWAQELTGSVRCAAVLLALLLVVDWGTGRLSLWRTTLWLALAGLLFVALYPARVSAGEGWLSSRRLLRTRRVRTDALVSVRCLDGKSAADGVLLCGGTALHLISLRIEQETARAVFKASGLE